MIRAMVEQEGRTVFISSHLLDEVEKTCDAAAIVDRGKVVTQGPIAELASGGGGAPRADRRRRRRRARAATLLERHAARARGSTRSDEGAAGRARRRARRAAAGVNAALVRAGIGVLRARARSPEPRAALPGDHLAARRADRARGGGGMNAPIAAADVRRRPAQAAQEAQHADLGAGAGASRRVVVFFIVKAAQHSSNPLQHEPAGGIHGYTRRAARDRAVLRPARRDPDRRRGRRGRRLGGGLPRPRRHRSLARSRCSPRVSRPRSRCAGRCARRVRPAAARHLRCSPPALPTPDASLVLNGLGFTLLATGVVCVVAVGFASLTASKAGLDHRADRLAARRQPADRRTSARSAAHARRCSARPSRTSARSKSAAAARA